MNYQDVFDIVTSVEGDVDTKVDAVRTEYPSLTFIGNGVHRIVFQSSSDSVVKIPSDQSHVVYNQRELCNYKSLCGTRFESWLAPIHVSSSSSEYIVMDSVDMSVNCEQKVTANITQAFVEIETGLDNFGYHDTQGAVAVDYTVPIQKSYRCGSYPN